MSAGLGDGQFLRLFFLSKNGPCLLRKTRGRTLASVISTAHASVSYPSAAMSRSAWAKRLLTRDIRYLLALKVSFFFFDS